jgi:pyruvate,water dikinase
LKIENHYSFPCDIEWAFEKGKFYIVQSRPITTLEGSKSEKNQGHLNYKFFYESQGYCFLLDDMIVSSYLSWPTVELRAGDWKRVYVPEKVIKENNAKGLLFTGDEINLKLSEIQKFTKKLRGISFSKVSEEVIFETVEIINKLFKHYSYFDTSYSEGIYIKNSKDERALLIEQSKNVVRDDFDFIFFRENGVLEKFIKRVAEIAGVEADEIRWYRVIEIGNLLKRKINLNTREINSRKKACVFNRNDNGQIDFLSGEKATSFIKDFDDDLEKESSAILRGAVAHGKSGKIIGKVCIIHRDYSNHKKLIEDMDKMEEKSILVTTTTDPEFMPAIKKSSAIITDIGGLLSHAAISAREINVPCIVGTENATKILKSGDIIEVDIENGLINKM